MNKASPVFRILCLAGLLLSSPVMAEENPDPWEGYNRPVYGFNDMLDKAFLKPTATAYSHLPDPVQTGVGNFFSNLGEVGNTFNNFLQGKPQEGMDSFLRLLINSTVGIGGLVDVASHMGIQRAEEDFGQTLGVWGVGPGPYFVLPVLGPSTVRDTIALPVDFLTDPVTHLEDNDLQLGLRVGRAVDVRAGLLGTEEATEGLTEDRYLLVRNAYLQNREFETTDGELDAGDYFEE